MIIEVVCIGITACLSFVAGYGNGQSSILNLPMSSEKNSPSNLPFDLDELVSRIELGMFKISSNTKNRIDIILTAKNFEFSAVADGAHWTDDKNANADITYDGVRQTFHINAPTKSRIKSAINNLNKNKVNSIFEEMDSMRATYLIESLNKK